MFICRTCCAGTATTVSGNVLGCSGASLSVSGMDVELTSGGTTLASTTTNSSGHYSATVMISGTISVTATVTPLSARFAVTASTGSVTAGISHTIGVTLAPATNYHCVTGCAYPVFATLTVVDAVWGTFTATWNSGLGLWTTGNQAITYPGYAPDSCAAGTLNATYILTPFPGGAIVVAQPSATYWTASGVTKCPGGSGATTRSFFVGSSGAQTQTCPGASTAATFTTVNQVYSGFPVSEQLTFGAATAAVTIKE